MINSNCLLLNDAVQPTVRKAMGKIADIGYSEAKISERLGLSDIIKLQWRAIPVYRLEKLAVRDPLASAIDIFLLQGAVPTVEINQLFDENERDALIRVGILSIDEQGMARAGASLYPVGNRLIFSDHAWPKFPHPGYNHIPFDQVMSIGSDSRWLANATVRHPFRNALDLCTGSGVHALLAASHSRQVLAVDLNPRAVEYTRFNTLISGLTNIEVVLGDLYQPAHDERFDLITANPPFVPSPVNSIMFRDGGSSGEEVQRRIIAGLPDHLAPGGIAQIVTELGEREDESLGDRLRNWLNGAPMDIHILRLLEHSGTNYAIRHAEGDDSYEAFFHSVQAWADNLKIQGYSRIVSVLLAFKWSDPQLNYPWTRMEEAQPPRSYAGAEIEAAFYTESMAHYPNFQQIIEHSRISRAEPIGIMESRVLGNDLYHDIQVRLMGKSLSTTQSIDAVERAILEILDKPLTFSELLTFSSELKLDRETVFAAARSLFKRKLILLKPDVDIL